MDINTKIAEELGIRKEQASAAVKLIDEGCTIPFYCPVPERSYRSIE